MPSLLTRYTVAQVVHAAVLLLLVGALAIQTVRIEGFKIWPLSIAGLKADLQSAKDELTRISARRNEQKQTTQGKLVETRIIYRDAGKVAERIEKAPTAPDCKTPEAVLSADL